MSDVAVSLPRAVSEVIIVWAASFAAIVLTFLLYRRAAPMVATVSFLYLPLWLTRRRGEELSEYGLTLRHWRADLRLFLLIAAILTPLFVALSWAFFSALPLLPPWLAERVSPVVSAPHLHLALPPHFGRWILTELLVVALPEELFYRGFIQSRLRDAWPEGRLLWGGRLGRALWVTAVLFALGHLAIFEVWRLAVFFPALLFGWMRERTGTVVGSTLMHAYCNLLQMVIAASFF